MSVKLAQLKRRLHIEDKPREEQPPVDNSAELGAALQQLIKNAVQEGMAEHKPKLPAAERLQNIDRQVAESAPRTIQQQSSSDFPPSVKQTKPPRDMTIQIHRDKTHRPIKVSVGNVMFNIQRGADGRVVRMVEAKDGVATTVPPAPLNEA
jgi:hypothetical protein